MKGVIDGRSYSHEVLEHYRFRAIYLHKEGRKVNDIADYFGIHRGSVSRWITNYKQSGRKALKSRKSDGRPCKLNQEDMHQILLTLRENPLNCGFETPLWDCKRVRQIVQEKCNKNIHQTNIMRWLKRLNFTYQKPARRALEQDKKAVKKWLSEEWPKIKAHAKRWQAMIYFQDEAGVSLIPVMGKTWAPKGKTPIVRVTGHKGTIIVTSAISPAGRMVFRIENEKIKAPQHIEFLQQILDHHPHRKIIVVEDRARPHIAEKVEHFVMKHKKRLALYHLPSYCPELNPDEHVWEYLKAKQLRSHQAQTKDQLKSLVKRKMQSIQRRPLLISSFFSAANVT